MFWRAWPAGRLPAGLPACRPAACRPAGPLPLGHAARREPGARRGSVSALRRSLARRGRGLVVAAGLGGRVSGSFRRRSWARRRWVRHPRGALWTRGPSPSGYGVWHSRGVLGDAARRLGGGPKASALGYRIPRATPLPCPTPRSRFGDLPRSLSSSAHPDRTLLPERSSALTAGGGRDGSGCG